ncbi:MAG TPA: tRNA (adenosine(37)-N6)-threonylcarbamoyltransferase complex transferase subunit TsaD [Elusimicrobia bacterium]|nr:tRNA (adenosine(37)-N6)-threonylcarbamoyltransferase complex transferase subunit TsaD [Elusimicrobiota bacterium]
MSPAPVVLGIETSCDETAAAVVRGGRVLSSVVSSQADLHSVYSGVVPELASRAHMERVASVMERAVRGAFGGAPLSSAKGRLGAVAFTRGPGLAGALLVGKVAAQALARAAGLPLVGVNHLEAHALAIALALPQRRLFPYLALIASGGHTDLLWVEAPGRYRVLGRTRDDAAGEVFDKVAKLLKLPYPGGPSVERAGRSGDPSAVPFPRPILPGCWDFSFSGLKTAVLYHVRDHAPKKAGARFVSDICASFQEAVVDTLIEKTLSAAEHLGARRVVLGGGVAANGRLREKFLARAGRVEVLFPPLSLCTDNAAMIAHAGSLRLKRPLERVLRIDPNLPVRSWS